MVGMAPSSYRFIICHYTTRYPILTQRIVNKSWHSHMKGLQPFVEDFQRAFTADGVAEEDREKVDDLVVPQAPPCKAHALTDGGKDALLTKMLDLAPGPGGQAASRSPAWSARRWPWKTLCSTSCKRRWLLRDVLLPVGEDKVRQPPLWGEGA